MTTFYIALAVIFLANIVLFVYLYFKVKREREWDEVLKNTHKSQANDDEFINFS